MALDTQASRFQHEKYPAQTPPVNTDVREAMPKKAKSVGLTIVESSST